LNDGFPAMEELEMILLALYEQRPHEDARRS
jgi:hypothetical protein